MAVSLQHRLCVLAATCSLIFLAGFGGKAAPNITAAKVRAGLTPPPPARALKAQAWRRDTENAGANPQNVPLAQLGNSKTRNRLRQVGFLQAYVSLWTRESSTGGVNAEAAAVLFRDTRGALGGGDVLRSLFAKPHPNSSRGEALPRLHLGTGGWGVHSHDGDEDFSYGFVLGNAVILVDMLCWDGNCPPAEKVKEATAEYAKSIATRLGR